MARKDESIAQEARIACEKFRQYFHENINQYHFMFDFVYGKQWDDDEEEALQNYNKRPMQFNKLGAMANSLLGEQQQNTPQLEIVPLSNCDEQTSSIRQIIVKDLILSSDAKEVYQNSAMQSFIGGYGAFMWDTDYSHNKSFDLDIVIRSFKDATRVYWDVGAELASKIDGMHCGYVSRMTRDKLRETFGEDVEEDIAKESSITATKSEIALATEPRTSDDPFSWSDNSGITINHFFKRTFEKATLYKLSNGEVLDQDEMDRVISQSQQISEQLMQQQMFADADNEYNEGLENDQDMDSSPDSEVNEDMQQEDSYDVVTLYYQGEIVRIEEKREIKKSKIMYYKIAGDYILEEGEFPSEDLPIVFVDQKSYFRKDGKQICIPFFNDAIDTQRYINYLGTQSAYILKVSRWDSFMGSKDNVQSLDTQQIWADPSAVQGMLVYDESPNGHKPEQLRPPELPVSLVNQYQRAIEDLYTSTGLYPNHMGQEGNEISGAAIDSRTRQGSNSTFGAFNSINKAITAGGSILNQMIPRVYDTQRVINLMTPEEGRKNITINKQSDEYGEVIENDLSKGQFEVRLQAGPSYEGQKQQTLQSLFEILKVKPDAFDLIADLVTENLPLPNTIEIKNRFKTLVPPGIMEAGKSGKMPQETGQQQPNPEQQAMQMEMQFKQKEIELKERELQIKEMEIQSKIQIENMEIKIKEMELAAAIKEKELGYMAETGRTESDEAIAHANNLVKILTHQPKGVKDEQ